jgi:hypothetical protein
VADQPAIADQDGVDRAYGGSGWRQFVEQVKHRFLVWKRDVDARKAPAFHIAQQRAQLLTAGAGNLDKLVAAVHTQGFAGLLMHRRRSRMRDRKADQSGEKALAG